MHEQWHTMDPCKEWDNFVCHGYRSKNTLADGQLWMSPMHELGDQIKKWVANTLTGSFESLCVKMSESSDLCGVNVLTNQQLEDDRRNFHLVKSYYGKCKETYSKNNTEQDLNYFLSVIFEGDGKAAGNVSKLDVWKSAVTNMFSLGFPTFVSIAVDNWYRSAIEVKPNQDYGLPDYSLYTGATLKAYVKEIQTFFFHNVDWSKNDTERSSTFARHIVQIERELREVQLEQFTGPRESARGTVKMNADQLAALLPHFPIAAMLESAIPAPRNNPVVFHVESPKLLAKIDALIASIPVESLLAYQYWHAFRLTHTMWKIDWKESLGNPKTRIEKHLGGQTAEQYCAEAALKGFSFILDSFFVCEISTSMLESVIKMLFRNVKTAAGASISQTSWLSNVTRQTLERKLNNVSLNPRHHFYTWNVTDPSIVGEYYAGLRLGDSGAYADEHEFVNQYIRIREWIHSKNWENLGVPTRSEAFPFPERPATVVNAMHDSRNGKVSVLAGLAQMPFVGHGLPHVINFARLGSIIGHEIFHAFDSNNMPSTVGGVPHRIPLTKEESGYFKKGYSCIKRGFGKVKVWGMGNSRFTIDPELLQAEAFADLHGVEAAYMAWKTIEPDSSQRMTIPGFHNVTAEQLFWILHSSMWCGTQSPETLDLWGKDPHPPLQFRTWKGVMTTRGWKEAFKCTKKKETCNIFGNQP
ncbi:hypothetical protein NLG97_g1780 [Lecanicillium saksenae]|uniref:Uncharacterized protein n=1 Tax=Lecanicillium saksenae TaxID=468837 RepID=A0ACC1R6X8_9HYPO|nr:hypothetical protein NLG97_g1780 [Lecanicillium saksenae]